MIITKDMLKQKGCSVNEIRLFNNEFPNGFDFSDPTQDMPVYVSLEELARLFSFTGLYTNADSCNIYQVNFINGLVNDFPNGDPARIEFSLLTKKPKIIHFVQKGKLQNPKKLYPACLSYYSNGKLISYIFCENGKVNDPFPDIPARVTFYRTGIISQREYFLDGVLNDSASGLPARTYYREDGSIKGDEKYTAGQYTVKHYVVR